MRNMLIAAVALMLVGCMEKQADGTYKVTTKTETVKAHDNAVKAGESVRKATDEIANSDAAQKVRAGAKELGRKTEKGLGVVATSAGKKLQEVGQKAQEDATKHH